jgi:dolichol-phosphate mannosyltransferase
MTTTVSDRAPVPARLYHRARATITGRFVKFAVVGGSGFVVNTATLALVSGSLGVHYVAGAVVATLSSTTTNFVLTDAWVFRDRAGSARLIGRFSVFLALSLATLVLRGPILIGLTELASLHYLVSNALSLIALMLLRYRFSGAVIWPEVTP